MKAFVRSLVVVLVAGLLWFGASGTGFADLRIVTEAEGERTETFFKGNRIASPMLDGSNFVFYCDVGQIAVISPRSSAQYWQGTFDDLRADIEALWDFDLGDDEGADDGGMPDLGALLGGLFGGGGDKEETQVRVTKKGSATVAGYAADHYVVETGSKNKWRVFEERWISADLLRELTAEVGTCIDYVLELEGALEGLSPFGLGDLEAVLASPDYQALMTKGFPVRSVQTLRIFGMETKLSDEVVEVSRERISEDVFTIPPGYKRVDSALQLFGDM